MPFPLAAIGGIAAGAGGLMSGFGSMFGGGGDSGPPNQYFMSQAQLGPVKQMLLDTMLLGVYGSNVNIVDGRVVQGQQPQFSLPGRLEEALRSIQGMTQIGLGGDLDQLTRGANAQHQQLLDSMAARGGLTGGMRDQLEMQFADTRMEAELMARRQAAMGYAGARAGMQSQVYDQAMQIGQFMMQPPGGQGGGGGMDWGAMGQGLQNFGTGLYDWGKNRQTPQLQMPAQQKSGWNPEAFSLNYGYGGR